MAQLGGGCVCLFAVPDVQECTRMSTTYKALWCTYTATALILQINRRRILQHRQCGEVLCVVFPVNCLRDITLFTKANHVSKCAIPTLHTSMLEEYCS